VGAWFAATGERSEVSAGRDGFSEIEEIGDVFLGFDNSFDGGESLVNSRFKVAEFVAEFDGLAGVQDTRHGSWDERLPGALLVDASKCNGDSSEVRSRLGFERRRQLSLQRLRSTKETAKARIKKARTQTATKISRDILAMVPSGT